MTSWNHGKHLLCWIQFLNLKCYVFKMFLPNFNRIEWKMEKQQLFQNRLFLALFILTWEKYNVIVTSLLIWFGFFHRKLFILSESISVQNLSSLLLKTKELWKGGGKHPPPPQCYNETKTPSAYRVKRMCFNQIIASRIYWNLLQAFNNLWFS